MRRNSSSRAGPRSTLSRAAAAALAATVASAAATEVAAKARVRERRHCSAGPRARRSHAARSTRRWVKLREGEVHRNALLYMRARNLSRTEVRCWRLLLANAADPLANISIHVPNEAAALDALHAAAADGALAYAGSAAADAELLSAPDEIPAWLLYAVRLRSAERRIILGFGDFCARTAELLGLLLPPVDTAVLAARRAVTVRDYLAPGGAARAVIDKEATLPEPGALRTTGDELEADQQAKGAPSVWDVD